LPGSDIPEVGPLASLGTIPLPDPDAQAQSVTLLAECESHYEVLVVYDGVDGGAATRFRVPKP
jgi:hypothetical protein